YPRGVSLSSLLKTYEIDRVRFLKIDCEGCEWSFLTSKDISRVDEIIGEFHFAGRMDGVHALLDATHEVTYLGGEDTIGLFRAATPRGGYASHELTDAATRAFGEQYAYWPCFVFVGRKHLFATDLEFGGMNWTIGETLLGHQLREPAVADTFVWASYQLRALGI